ncbi:MAG: SMP-30/gluconolactonase/LRE family protein [Pseudolysinimonas sp.]
MAYEGIAATDAVYDLAEGVLWDDHAGLVRWVDIWAGRVLSGRLETTDLHGTRIVDTTEIVIGDYSEAPQTAGAVALAEDGGLLIAAARGLATISPDAQVSFGPDLLGSRGNVRLNDGSVDPQGRFVVGSLSLTDETGTEVLLRVNPDGMVETLRTGIRLSNGIAFSPDGSTIYHVDSLARTISSHAYEPGAFDSAEPWVTIVDELPHSPDGLTVSADGDLWIAQFGGSGVVRYSSAGKLIDEVTIDATQATCPAFVGPGLDILVISSAQEGLDVWADKSGALFVARPGAVGLPVPRWSGSTTTPYWKAAPA